MKFNIAGSLAIASLISLAPHAQAQNFMDLLKGYLGTGTISSQTQSVIKTNINTRQAQLEAEVAAGASAGQLTPQEESDLRAELNRIAALEGQYLTDGNFSNTEVQSMLTELSNFSTRLQGYLSNASTTANSTYNSGWFHQYGRGNRSGYPGNQTQFQANIDTKQAQIDASIQQGTMAGLLTWTESANFKATLNRIANDETRMLADGRLSYRESQTLIADLETLETQVTQTKAAAERRGSSRRGRGHYGRQDRDGRWIDSRQSLLSQRIQSGLATGRLTRSEADRLFRDEARVNSLEAQLRLSGSTLTWSEQRRLMAELDQLSRRINKELSDKQVQ